MFFDGICKICVHRTACHDYRSGSCDIQDEIFSPITADEENSVQRICKACDELMWNTTSAWYAKVHILRNTLGMDISSIASICDHSKNATYTAIRRAKEYAKLKPKFNTRLLLIYHKLKEGRQ